LPIRNDILIN